ncbi:hypothetical protein BaRGS_00016231 [Batillaria attramentaria]|uniref:Transmembrane protein n=1 Tax=Batillaria attramentaria TaxID=370345 RepID=A0ABD0L0B9_9CAEN
MATEQNSTSPSAEAEATMSATALELLLPPAACLLAIIFGLILWAALNRKKTAPMVIQQDTVKDANHFKSQHPNTGTRSEKSTRIQPFSADVSHPAFFTDSSADLRCNQNNNEDDLMAESIPTKLCAVQPLFSSQDLQLLENLDMRSLADIRELFCILLPVIFSLGFCPLTLFLHGSIVGLFWPHSMFASPPNINDAISCFLVPAGMVYAISFGFAFQQVAGGFRETEISMLKQVDQLKTILKIVDDLRVVHPAHRVTMVRTVKDVALATISQLRGHVVHNDNMTDEPERNLWGKSLDDIVRLAYTSAKVKDGDMWQSALLRRLEKLVVHDDSFFMLSLKRRIHAVQ